MKQTKLIRFGISMEEHLLEKFDAAITKKRYNNRSEAVRDLIREFLVEEEWDKNKEVAGTITLVYDHEVRELSDRLTELQHEYHTAIRSTLHIHLDAHYCLEVLVVIGKSHDIRIIADRLIGTRGVKHGKLTTATTGKSI